MITRKVTRIVVGRELEIDFFLISVVNSRGPAGNAKRLTYT